MARNHETTRKNLIRKGQKTAYEYMKGQGYWFFDCQETAEGYESEWHKTHAGITIDEIVIVYSKKWRVKDVR